MNEQTIRDAARNGRLARVREEADHREGMRLARRQRVLRTMWWRRTISYACEVAVCLIALTAVWLFCSIVFDVSK